MFPRNTALTAILFVVAGTACSSVSMPDWPPTDAYRCHGTLSMQTAFKAPDGKWCAAVATSTGLLYCVPCVKSETGCVATPLTDIEKQKHPACEKVAIEYECFNSRSSVGVFHDRESDTYCRVEQTDRGYRCRPCVVGEDSVCRKSEASFKYWYEEIPCSIQASGTPQRP